LALSQNEWVSYPPPLVGGGKGNNALEDIFLYQLRNFSSGIMPAVFEEISHPGTKLICPYDFLKEAGHNRVLRKGRKICRIDQPVPMGLVAVFSKQPVGFNNKLDRGLGSRRSVYRVNMPALS